MKSDKAVNPNQIRGTRGSTRAYKWEIYNPAAESRSDGTILTALPTNAFKGQRKISSTIGEPI